MGRAYAELLDREAKVTATTTELKPLLAAKELAKTSKLKAAESLGWTLDELQQEYLASLGGTRSPEEIARAAARAELDSREAARQEATKNAEQEATTRQQQETQKTINDCASSILDAAAPILGELDVIVSQGRTPYEVMQWYASANKALPTDFTSALRAYEAHLRAQLAAKGFTKVPAAAPTTDRGPATRGTTAAITPADAGEVPLRRVPNGKPLSAIERARLAMQELNIPE